MEELLYSNLNGLSTFLLIVIIATCLYVLSKGADLLVDEAVSLSIRWGVPKVIIGATIVSLGTTLPEVTVSVMAAVNGNPDLALGNAIGSIIADTGLIIGLAALIGRLPVDQKIIKRQGLIQILSAVLLSVASLPFFSKGPEGRITQPMGFVFIGLLILYIVATIRWGRNSNKEAPTAEMSEKTPLILELFKLVLGMVLVIISSKVLIPSVEITAIRVGIPQSVIAATLVAFGTSLPELVTAITAVKKDHGELAVGNIIGADILNVLFVTGSAAAVTKGGLLVPTEFYKLQIPTMLIILSTFRLFSKNGDDTISKLEGLLLLAIYTIYLILNYTWI